MDTLVAPESVLKRFPSLRYVDPDEVKRLAEQRAIARRRLIKGSPFANKA